jgi:iron complex transport system substrate-binding protein
LGVGPAAAGSGAVGGFPVTLRDATGTLVVVAHPPRRIVSLAPSVTEILFALGLDREIVGIGDADDYPPDRVRTKPRVGGVVIDIERIVSLEPDLVIGMPSLQRDQLDRLRALRLRVLAVDAFSLSDVVQQIWTIGQATGRTAQAAAVASHLEQRARSVSPARSVRVYVEAWGEPLLAAAAGTLVEDLVRRAGGRNIFSDRRGYIQVPMETVLVRNPQVILLLYPGRDQVLTRPGWRRVEAVRSGRVYEVPTSIVVRPGPRIAEGLGLIADRLSGRR